MKLVKMMRYLKGLVKDVLTLKADRSGMSKWCTDASFAVHPDYQSHTRAIMTMGVTSISRKQGMNTQSLTEAEVVAADEVVLDKVVFGSTRQPSERKHPISRQPECYVTKVKGRQSAGKHSRHLNISLFFTKDQN
jgi:hypothetical protein